MGTYSVFIALIVVVCFLLILIIMVQNPKGGGLSSSFGGGQQMGGVQKTTDFLDRSTWVLGGILLGLILLSNVALERPQATSLDSRLLDSQEQTIPESIPESAPVEIPEVPAGQLPE